jgi:hypothetical protein
MTEFDDVIRLLRENRPEATELELDQIKQRVRRRTAQQPSRRREAMKSRIAILSMLVLGMLFSTAGAGLAVQGLTNNDASVAQYGPDEEQPAGDVLGEEESGGGGAAGGGASEGGAAGEEAVQPARQVAAGSAGNELPFTGFLAIPVLIGGVALLSTGLVLRRQARRDDEG